MISTKEFEEYCKIAKANGVKNLVLDGLKIEFSEIPQSSFAEAIKTKDDVVPTEDQFLLWSTEHMPDHGEEQ